VRALDSLSKARYDTAVPVVAFFPVGRFGAPPDDSLHLSPYGVQAKTLVLDGTTKIPVPDDVGQYGPVFSGYIDVAKSESAFVSLGLVSAVADTASGRLVVWAAVDSAPAGADLRLLAVVTQDSFMTAGSFPMRFDHVARRILPDHYGVALPPARGDTLVDTFDFSTAGLLPAYLRAAVFVENAADHTIAQALNVPGFLVTD